jgi:hypothetical protein
MNDVVQAIGVDADALATFEDGLAKIAKWVKASPYLQLHPSPDFNALLLFLPPSNTTSES